MDHSAVGARLTGVRPANMASNLRSRWLGTKEWDWFIYWLDNQRSTSMATALQRFSPGVDKERARQLARDVGVLLNPFDWRRRGILSQKEVRTVRSRLDVLAQDPDVLPKTAEGLVEDTVRIVTNEFIQAEKQDTERSLAILTELERRIEALERDRDYWKALAQSTTSAIPLSYDIPAPPPPPAPWKPVAQDMRTHERGSVGREVKLARNMEKEVQENPELLDQVAMDPDTRNQTLQELLIAQVPRRREAIAGPQDENGNGDVQEEEWEEEESSSYRCRSCMKFVPQAAQRLGGSLCPRHYTGCHTQPVYCGHECALQDWSHHHRYEC